MKPKLMLSLATGQLLLELVPPSAGLMRKLLDAVLRPGRAGTLEGPQQARAKVALSGVIAAGDLRARLEHAISRIKDQHHGSIAGLDLEVQLGLDHAHIGLMVLEDVAATALTSETREAYVQAWLAQMLHLDAATQVVRWQILADPHKLLISCVDRAVFETLSEFAAQHGLRIVSCRPAVLSAIAAQLSGKADAEAATSDLTVVWTEPGAGAARSNRVQLLRFHHQQFMCAWRVWAPLAAHSVDSALESAVRRFQARHGAAASDGVKRLHWPSIVVDTASNQ